ncbi:hypothetical protein SESBI_39960 [Sesbania bispinosa]|nr:hypothetical protein SESBI_39960 [Sesbania bispinosa]
MVARTPPKQRKTLAALNPVLIKETLNKVDRCMARLQELQYTVTGGTKVVSGVSLSPRSTRGYLRTSLRCKQESARIKNGASRRSPVGKFPSSANTGEWRRMSLPAMLVGETVGEILQASQFAREIVSAVKGKSICQKTAAEDPKTPMSQRSNQKVNPENTQLKARRKKEKQAKQQNDGSPSLQRARSRINFKVVSPPKVREFDNSHSSNSFCKTRSPIISRNRGTPHKFLIKSPPSTSKFQVKIKSPPPVSISPTRPTSLSRSSPKRSVASKFRRSFSPSRLATRIVSLSPLKSRKSVPKSDGLTSGLKQRPASTVRFPGQRI